ncbi:unnamed protein product, partial [Mesorhabditis belari]|uniref:Deoxyhypusine hydroxylase n=1 Tax=Mesorhabditis belari TaxID=2138241 RepID=A0AAF3EQP4_9BILA
MLCADGSGPREGSISIERIDQAGKLLNDGTQPLAKRFQALFFLRNIRCDRSVSWISKGFSDPSALLKHELAYCLGQMENKAAVPEFKFLEPMVRHEAAEALGAIGDHAVRGVLQSYCNDPMPEVAETCQLALQRLDYVSNGGKTTSPYDSIDPTPSAETSDIAQLQETLTNEKNSLWDRYKAMFKLRNISTDESIKALASGLYCEDSALFRHEIAYVLGQVQNATVIQELKDRLMLSSENCMVRHECAEALGAIATDECEKILKEYAKDNEQVVRESCEVALDMADYENSEQFQYASHYFDQPTIAPSVSTQSTGLPVSSIPPTITTQSISLTSTSTTSTPSFTGSTTIRPYYTSPAPDPFAIGTLKIGFMVADGIRPTEIGFSQSGGVISIALDEMRRQNILNHWNIEFYLNFTECNETTAAGTAVEMFTQTKVDAVIGPPCNQAIFPVAVLSSFYQIPQFVWGYSNANAYANGNRFPYLNVITPNSLQYGYALVSIMQLYNWNQVGIVYSTDEVAYCDNMIADFETAVADPIVYGVDITIKATVDSLNSTSFDPVMSRVKQRARVVLLCFMSDYRYRQFFISAYRNNMTGPDYVYIGLKMGGYGFAQASYVNSTSVDRFSDGSVPIWVDGYRNNVDGQNNNAKMVASRILILDIQRSMLSVSGMNADDYRYAVLTKLRDYPFYCGTVNCTNNIDTGDGVAVYTSYFHDAFFQFALVANASLANNNNVYDPVKVNSYVSSTISSFQGYSGFVEMTSNGTRLPQFFLYGLDPNYQQKLFLNISPISDDSYYMSVTELYTSETGSIWANRGGVRPLAKPVCGFTGDECPQSVWQQSGGYIIGGGVLLIVFSIALIFLAIYLYYQKKREQERLDAEWKIPHSMLETPNMREIDKSKISLQSGNSGNSKNTQGTQRTTKSTSTMNDKSVFFLSGEPVQTKTHHQTAYFTEFDFKQFREMRKMEHDNICRFLGLCIEVAPPMSVWKFCGRGSLDEAIMKSSLEFDGFFMYSLIRDIVAGLAYIHKSTLQMHGRFSSHICMIDDRWQLKISGFGLTSLKEINSEEAYQGLLWTSPEILRGNVVRSKAADVYAFAIVASQIVTRKSAFNFENRRESTEEIVYAVKKGLNPLMRPSIEVPDGVDLSPAIIHLIRDCWAESPDDRPYIETTENLVKAMNIGKNQNLMDHVFQMMESYAETLEKEVEDRTKQLSEEKKKSDILLNRMLPKQVAERLKLGQSIEPESYEMVTIFFCDVVKFTNLAARCTPLQIVNILNDLYSTFDTVVEKHSVYKVETIGDAYLCVSGLPVRNGVQHVKNIADMSLDFLETVKGFRISHMPTERIQLRVGMHSGPCVAGVVGLTMPRYCLFGDTVNTASRMESNGKPSMIHVSAEAHDLLLKFPGYIMEERGEVIIKGKGVMETFWLLGRNDNT